MIDQIKPNIYSNPQAFSPVKNLNGVDYAITKPLTDKQKNEVKEEKEKKSNALGYSIATTALIGGFGVFALMKGLPNGARLKVDKFIAYLESKSSLLKDSKHLTSFQKFSKVALAKLEKLADQSRSIFNVSSIKDASFKAAIDKIPFMKRFDERITGLFERISVKTLRNSYAGTMSKFDDLYPNMAELTAKLEKGDQQKANKLISKIKSNYRNYFTAEPRNGRFINTKNDLSGLHEKVRDRIFNVKEFVQDKETYTTFFPEELASGAKTNLKNRINPKREQIGNDLKDLLDIYKNSSISEKEYLKIEKQVNKAIKSLDKSINIESELLFEKLRDLEIGSAPTDILGVLTSLGLVGWGLTKADNKDQRMSVGLKYGIPAVGAIVTSLYCTVRLVSGGKSLIFGLVSGALINKLGESLDKYRKKYEEKPIDLKTIPSLIINPLSLPPSHTALGLFEK